MIGVSTARAPLPENLLDEPKGFVWWYLDLVDDAGNGIVLIWSYGLPFLPGSRLGGCPRFRPSLNLAVYRDHVQDLYLFNELHPADAVWDPAGETWTFGRSTFSVRRSDNRVAIDIQLDTPVGGQTGRLTGAISAEGPLRGDVDDASGGDHAWSPVLMAADGEAHLELEGWPSFSVRGRVYHDRNGSRVLLNELGIARWQWGRISFPDRDVSWYLLDPSRRGAPPRAILLSVDRSGAATLLERTPYSPSAWRLDRYGLSYHRRLHIQGDGAAIPDIFVDQQFVVDRGPFYLRWLVHGHDANGAAGHGVSELVVPSRLDIPALRPMVATHVFQEAGDNSSMVSMFSGPQKGRFLRWWALRNNPRLLEGQP